MLADAPRAEADACADALTEVVDEDGHRNVVRYAHAGPRTVMWSHLIGPCNRASRADKSSVR